MFTWEVVDPAPGEAVAPHQRLAWGKTIGLGAQHVVAMFGATFVFLARVVARAAGTDDGDGAVFIGPSGADRTPPAADDHS